MKRIVYLSLAIFYAAIGLLGSVGNDYMEVDGANRLLRNNLLFIIPIALIVGSLVSYFFPKVFPNGYGKQNKISKVFIPLIFFTLSFTATIGIFLFINASFGNQTAIKVEGYIESKWSKKRTKGRYDYFLGLRDSVSGQYYEFEVSKNIYEQIGNKGDRIRKYFYKGSLGVIYRYSY